MRTAKGTGALPTQLTDDGARLLSRACRAVAEVERRMLHALSASSAERLRQDLTACATALSANKP
ncbi:hypothetical protein [Lentzea atacamensis]|uniref:hypothetical protein n=1 Tax=Lentzea atacamensis TaxID=531938 RepID=UPI001F39FAD6|nr:hypothetical protein [Lentzea atacamensis]